MVLSRYWRGALAALAVVVSGCGGGSGSEQLAGAGGGSTQTFSLSVAVTGSGTVAAAGTGISCTSQCSGAVPAGTTVALTATAGSGYQFVGWGGACNGTGSCSVTLNQATTVTAEFATVPANSSPLTVSKAGSGTITSSPAGINCGTDCSEAYTTGTSVTLTAQPASGYTFSGWSGPCSGTGTCVVTMSQARVVSATFTGSSSGAGCSLTRGTATSPTFASAHPKVLLNHAATKSCLQTLLSNGTGSATRFKNMVDSQLAGGNIYGFEPWYAALMYQVTGEQRYATYAIQQTDAFVASEEALIAANQRATVAGDSYLEVGPIIGSLAVVYDWAYDLMTPAQRTRWINYANQTVWNVWNYQQAKWGNTTYAWSGWSVDNPSNNYYYSFLRATMLLGLATHGENPQAQRWLDKFRVEKMEGQLFPTFNRELAGGGSREGTGYGTAMKGLWQLYDWWEKSTGERIATRTPHTLASMAHLMHSIVPTLDRLAPTGDHARDSSAALFDYHREYLLELQALFPDEHLSGIARTLLESSSVPQMKNSFMFFSDFLYEQPDLPARPLAELSTTYWAPGTGQLMMRSAWEPSATYANFICGPYTESHAHRDQGSFVLFKGAWLATDANVFSRSGIEQDEELHNLVRFESGGAPVKQAYGTNCSLAALADNRQFTYASARVTASYRNPGAVQKSEREFLFIKPDVLVVLDRAAAAPGTRRIWTLNLGGMPEIAGDTLSYAEGRSRLEVRRLAPAGLTAEVRAWPEMRKNMQGGVRVDVGDTAVGPSLFMHVFSLDGAVASAARSDAPGQTGVLLKLADGRSATARFSNQGSGGTLDLRAADQSAQFGGALPTGVTPPPLFAN